MFLSDDFEIIKINKNYVYIKILYSENENTEKYYKLEKNVSDYDLIRNFNDGYLFDENNNECAYITVNVNIINSNMVMKILEKN